MPTKKIKLREKINRLEEIGKFFNNSSESLDLEIAVEKYEEAAKLITEIKSELKSLELKIEEIKLMNEDEEQELILDEESNT